MIIPWTLQRYLFFEMGKTFLLAAVGLTAVLGLGGGVLNMVELGQVTPGQFARMMIILLPLSAALTLPLAALFAAASTYGRVSANNELTACRSSGINIHILFLPALLLSLLAALVTFVLFNFLIPSMVMNLEKLLMPDLKTIIENRLNRSRGLGLGNLRIFADDTTVDVSNPNLVELTGVVFVETDDEDWERFGTVGRVVFQMDESEKSFSASATLIDLNYYDPKTGQSFSAGVQPINDIDALSNRFRYKLKFLQLGELLHFRSYPLEWHTVEDELERLRIETAMLAVYDQIFADWSADQELILNDNRTTYRIFAERGGQRPREGTVELGAGDRKVRIEVNENGGRRRIVEAQRLIINIPHAKKVSELAFHLEAYNVSISAIEGGDVIEKPKERLTPIAVPGEYSRSIALAPDHQLLKGAEGGENATRLERRIDSIKSRRDSVLREIDSTLSERLAFSTSVCVLVILGAALGIVLRGSHVLTAFGISFVPMLGVIITLVMGKQLAQNEGTTIAGLALTWSGIAVVLVIDLWMLAKVVRR